MRTLGRLTQRLEYFVYTEGVGGSNPSSPIELIHSQAYNPTHHPYHGQRQPTHSLCRQHACGQLGSPSFGRRWAFRIFRKIRPREVCSLKLNLPLHGFALLVERAISILEGDSFCLLE
jgi:hypothetical protein